MKGFAKLGRDSRGQTNRRKAKCPFLLLCWLLPPIWSALAEETLEAQSIRFRLIPGGWYFVGSLPNETGRDADEAPSHKVNLKPIREGLRRCAPKIAWLNFYEPNLRPLRKSLSLSFLIKM